MSRRERDEAVRCNRGEGLKVEPEGDIFMYQISKVTAPYSTTCVWASYILNYSVWDDKYLYLEPHLFWILGGEVPKVYC